MAIYHFSAKVVSRAKGQSTIATAAYNAREKLTDKRTGEVKDYSHKDGLVFSGIYTPKNAPEWAKDREQLWNKAEESEKRKDSTIARNYTVALPHELNTEQQRYLVQDFIKENFTRKGYAADLSIHAPDKDGDERNYHGHILVTDRRIEPDGFAADKKERQLKSNERKDELENLRESWERHGNRHLERHGFEPNLDRRTLEAQGIDREPTQHKGADVCAMERRGIETDRGNQAQQIEARNSELEALKLEAAKIAREIITEQQQLREQITATRNGKNKQTMNEDNEQEQKKRGVSGYDKGGMVAQQAEALREHNERQKILDIENAKLKPENAQDKTPDNAEIKPERHYSSCVEKVEEKYIYGGSALEFSLENLQKEQSSIKAIEQAEITQKENQVKELAEVQTEKLKAESERTLEHPDKTAEKAIEQADITKTMNHVRGLAEAQAEKQKSEPTKNLEQPDKNTERVKYIEDHETHKRQNEADKSRDNQKSIDYAAARSKDSPFKENGKELTDAQRARMERAAKLLEGMQRERGDNDRELGGGRERTRDR